MKDYIHLKNLVFNTPHFCTQDYAETVLSVLSEKLNIEEGAYQTKEEEREKRAAATTASGTYVLPILGSMTHRAGNLDALSGIKSYQAIQADIEAALEDPKVKNILLEIDSPGGTVAGAFDFRDFLMEAKQKKPIYALAKDTMASAAYLIGSAATKVYMTQTAKAGSIGVVAMLTDQTKADEDSGVKPIFLSAGDYKTAGNPHIEMTEDHLSYLQESINESYEMFVGAVAEARGLDPQVIRDTEARMYGAKKAVDLGLADGIRTFDATLEELANVSPKQVTTSLNMKTYKGKRMEDVDVTQLMADLEKSKAENETLKAAILGEGYTITAEGVEKAAEPEMIEIAGVMTDKATLPAHVVQALETAAEEKAEAALKEKASLDLPNFSQSAAVEILKVVGEDAKIMESLKAADAALGMTMEESGESVQDGDLLSATDRFEALVDAKIEEGMEEPEARAEVTQSKEGMSLIKEIRKGV